MFTPVIVRGDLARMVVGGQRWYSANTLQAEKEEETGWEKKTTFKSQQEEIMDRKLYKLDMDVRRTGRALSFELEKIVRMIERSGLCTTNQALLVLRCCGDVLVDIHRDNRTLLVDRYSNILKKNGVVFDVSHYNAVLRVHLENQNTLAASDFLAEMEGAGITPNRVTFQHLVGMYCMEGNIAGATTILEHMKAQDMAINEAVFISLLKGHCANNDSDSVSATLEVMSSSELSLGAATYTAMACGYGRAGNWAKVEEVLGKTADEDVRLDDGDMFSIILACSQGGLCKEAESLVSKLPKKRGFFQELRNHLPQLAMSGNVKVATEIYLALDDKEGSGREGHGLFVVGPIARSGESLEVILEAVKSLEEAGFSSAMQFLVQEAALSWSKEKCEELVEIIEKEKEGEKVELNTDLLFRFLRGSLELERDPDKIMACMNNLHTMGVAMPWAFISSDLIPAMINLDVETPGAVAKKLKDTCPFMAWNLVSNMLLQSLFNKESAEYVSAATGFLLHVNIGHIRPDKWNSSLARSYLLTNRLEDLITVLFLASRKTMLGTQDPNRTEENMFRVLEHIVSLLPRCQPDTTPDQAITPVLEELARLHIGVPKSVVNKVRKLVKSEEAGELLDKAEMNWENREEFWTESEEGRCLAERKRLFKERAKIERGTKVGTSQSEYRGYFNVPESREQMEEIQAVLARRGDVSPSLSSNLILAYAADGMVDEAMDLLTYSQEKSDFSASPTNLESIVTGLVNQGRGKEALQLVEEQMDKDGKIFISTLMSALAGMANDGEHQKVLDMIGNVDRNKFLITKRGSNAHTLLVAYSSKGDAQRLEEVFNTLVTNNLASTEHINNLNPLVEVHLARDDLAAAVAELERIAKVFKKLPKKFEVTCRLIEEENVEAMQAILDTSIELIGEERSLYDLAYCFLHMNRRAQAKKLLETPGLRYEKDKIEYICSRFRNDGNLTGLEQLVSLSKSVFGCDRDYLYHQLVSAYSKDADKVADIWLQVQEEGHAPSDSLKIAIAKALKLGGQQVPFEEPVEYAEVEKNKENTTKKPTVERIVKNVDHLIDEDVDIALKTGDFNTAVELVLSSFEKENTSLRCKKDLIEALTKQNRLEEACQVATRLANNFENPRRIKFRSLYHRINEKLEDAKKEEFLSGLGPVFRELLEQQPDVKVNTETKSPPKNRSNSDEAARAALAINDMEGLVESIKTGDITIQCKNELLANLIAETKLDEASKVALAICNDNQKGFHKGTTKLICEIMKKWEENDEVKKTREFVSQFSPKLSFAVRSDIWVKAGLIRTDPSEYIELVRAEAENHQKWMVSSDVLLEAVEKHQDLPSRLEALATENFTPANELLSKLSIAQNNTENLEKHLKLCSEKVLRTRGGVFDKIDTIEKMEMVLEVLKRNGAEKEALVQAANNCLAIHLDRDTFVDIANKAVDCGVEVGSLARSVLNKLEKNTQFKLHSEVQTALSKPSS
eukprot:GFUD01007426.1.p1 GENE.GFUD01007426.1~~GFUD01007426.1.p1  ORF type:complete len:1519 (+),score=489.48 GFUD01007426.1:137-4558(+)